MKHHNGLETGWLIRRDVPAVLNVDFECYDRPLTEAQLLDYLRERNVVGFTGKISGDVVAHMVYSLEKDHISILRFCVHPNWQRQGIGRVFIERLFDKLSTQKRRYLECVVSERSDEAHLFLKACGFRATGVVWDHFGRDRDGYRFKLSLNVAALAGAVH